MVCPYCSSKEVGKIGVAQYYCWNCFLEWEIDENGKCIFYQVEEDGSLSCLNDIFGDDWFKEA
ncbi:hypothetical protein ACFPTR_13145 [Aliibacillus thermotolerans]|uniref:Uncharacterized protein n=1 Tax=Aliibacillus thermotolerans TaxID=1834418 RepID=A0ABW0UAB3_9BACI|nr:hypothetical protein [Aliibacillus thermotolerans]MDA3130799.1 hypothetical protein [Aliibacillus thermotolerans]